MVDMTDQAELPSDHTLAPAILLIPHLSALTAYDLSEPLVVVEAHEFQVDCMDNPTLIVVEIVGL